MSMGLAEALLVAQVKEYKDICKKQAEQIDKLLQMCKDRGQMVDDLMEMCRAKDKNFNELESLAREAMDKIGRRNPALYAIIDHHPPVAQRSEQVAHNL